MLMAAARPSATATTTHEDRMGHLRSAVDPSDGEGNFIRLNTAEAAAQEFHVHCVFGGSMQGAPFAE